MPKVITKTAVEIKGSVYLGGVPFEIDPYLYDSLVASGTTMILVEDQNKPKATEQSKKQEGDEINNPEDDLKQSSGKKKK
jgi:hypothetical protein